MDVSPMSLINQMLKELDARGSNNSTSGGSYASVRSVPDMRKNPVAVVVAVVSALVIGGAGMWFWLGGTAAKAPSPSMADTTAKAVATNPQAPVVQVPPQVQPVAVQALAK